MPLIQIVSSRGENLEEQLRENFFSDVVPRAGDRIRTKAYSEGTVKVEFVVIDYRKVQNENTEDNGEVIIYVYLKEGY